MAESASTSDDDDYAYGDANMAESNRYPVHDCCEFEDVETLRVRTGRALEAMVRHMVRPLSGGAWRELPAAKNLAHPRTDGVG